MEIDKVAIIIQKIADGFEENVVRCLDENRGIVYISIIEQLLSGTDGNGEYLDPDYDNDDFFDKPGRWEGKNEQYKAWKKSIKTPDLHNLGLPERPYNVPNLYIDGTFHSDITLSSIVDGLEIDPGDGNGPAIVEKYGEQILMLGPTAVEYFNNEKLLPYIEKFFNDCGYI